MAQDVSSILRHFRFRFVSYRYQKVCFVVKKSFYLPFCSFLGGIFGHFAFLLLYLHHNCANLS